MNSDLLAVIAAMSVLDLRQELRGRGVETESCIEKAVLVRLLVTNWDEPQPQLAASSSAASHFPRSAGTSGGDRLSVSGMRPSG